MRDKHCQHGGHDQYVQIQQLIKSVYVFEAFAMQLQPLLLMTVHRVGLISDRFHNLNVSPKIHPIDVWFCLRRH